MFTDIMQPAIDVIRSHRIDRHIYWNGLVSLVEDLIQSIEDSITSASVGDLSSVIASVRRKWSLHDIFIEDYGLEQATVFEFITGNLTREEAASIRSAGYEWNHAANTSDQTSSTPRGTLRRLLEAYAKQILTALPYLKKAHLRSGPHRIDEARLLHRWLKDTADALEKFNTAEKSHSLMSAQDSCKAQAPNDKCCDYHITQSVMSESCTDLYETWHSLPGAEITRIDNLDYAVLSVKFDKGATYPIVLYGMTTFDDSSYYLSGPTELARATTGTCLAHLLNETPVKKLCHMFSDEMLNEQFNVMAPPKFRFLT